MTPHADLVARLRKFVTEYRKIQRLDHEMVYALHSEYEERFAPLRLSDIEAAADALAALPPPADPPHDCEAWRLEGLGCARCNKADPPALVALVARIQNADAESEQAALRGDMAASAAATERGEAAYDDLLAYPLPAAPPVTDTCRQCGDVTEQGRQYCTACAILPPFPPRSAVTDTTSDAYERGKRDAVRALANATKKRLTDDSVASLVAALTTADAPASAPRFAVGIDTQTGENRCVRIDGDAIGDESAWLIERDINSVLHYWTSRVIDGREIGAWSPNHLDARRFARREDAACMLTWHCGDVGRVAEHMWTPMRPPVTDTPQGCPTCGGPRPCDRCTTSNAVDLDALKARLENERLRAAAEIVKLIADDSWAVTFQSLGQYRSALLKVWRDSAPAAPPQEDQ